RARVNRVVARAAVVVLGAVLALPRVARAYEFAIDLRTIGQGYQVRRFAPNGSNELLTRRRLTQFLNLSVFNLEPESWRADESGKRGPSAISFDASLRFESDF